jgi:ABC-2 type transport system permease protein
VAAEVSFGRVSFWGAVSAAFRRELAHIRSSGWDLALLFPLPLLAIIIVAAVFASGVLHDIPIALVDMDGSGLSRTITRNLLADRTLEVEATPRDLAAAGSLLRSGRVLSVLYLPPGLERDAHRTSGATATIYYNSAIQTAGTKAAGTEQDAVKTAAARLSSALERGPVRLNPPRVQVTIVGNPEQSFELFLQALVTPLSLNILLGCSAVFAVGRELAAGSLRTLGETAGGRWAAALIGKLAPHVLAIWAWMAVWIAYLAGLRGWRIEGGLPVLLLAQFVFLCSTAAISAFLVAALRDLGEALSIAALFFGSAMSFAGGTLPTHGGPLFTRVWSAVLPSTSYIQIQEQQWVLGSSILRSAPSLGLLLLFCVAPLAAAAAGLRKLAAAPPHEKALQAPPAPPGFLASFLQTLKVVAANKPIKSTIVASVVLYGFYYPLAYREQTVVQLPVAVADLDRSPWSRTFLRNLDATREVHIVAQADSERSAQALLRQDRVDAALVIPHGLQASLLKGSAGGVAVYLKGAYLVRVRFLGSAVSEAVQASLAQAFEPLRAAAPGVEPGVRVLQRPLYNVTGGYGGYAVPGVATVILQATLLFGVAMFMGLRRERDTWRMTPRAFLGVWAAFTLLGSLTSLFWFGFVFWFQDYPRAGNIPGMLLAVPVFTAAVSAMALLVGSLFERHERSMQLLAGTSVPFFFVAGLSWPSFAMPAVVVAVAKLIPSTSAVLMFVKLNSMGATLDEVAPDLAVLAFLAAIYGAAAMLRITRADDPGTSNIVRALRRDRVQPPL